MRTRIVLAIILLAVGLCLVPGVGYGEVKPRLYFAKPTSIDWRLMQSTVNYMQENPARFLRVLIHYDEYGYWGGSSSVLSSDQFPEYVDTKGKILVSVGDNIFRGDSKRVFYDKSGGDLLDEFKRQLEIIYSFIEVFATDMNADIVASFYTREKKPSSIITLGYFYQGEYHLWYHLWGE